MVTSRSTENGSGAPPGYLGPDRGLRRLLILRLGRDSVRVEVLFRSTETDQVIEFCAAFCSRGAFWAVA